MLPTHAECTTRKQGGSLRRHCELYLDIRWLSGEHVFCFSFGWIPGSLREARFSKIATPSITKSNNCTKARGEGLQRGGHQGVLPWILDTTFHYLIRPYVWSDVHDVPRMTNATYFPLRFRSRVVHHLQWDERAAARKWYPCAEQARGYRVHGRGGGCDGGRADFIRKCS